MLSCVCGVSDRVGDCGSFCSKNYRVVLCFGWRLVLMKVGYGRGTVDVGGVDKNVACSGGNVGQGDEGQSRPLLNAANFRILKKIYF